jgi:hypothetical protein
MDNDYIDNETIKAVYRKVLVHAISNYRGQGLFQNERKSKNIKMRHRIDAYKFLKSEWCLCICDTIGLNYYKLIAHMDIPVFEAELKKFRGKI